LRHDLCDYRHQTSTLLINHLLNLNVNAELGAN
jgi:hypothetical protein